jgi:hypothetical protein
VKTLSVKVDESLKESFKQACKKDGRLVEFVIAELMRQWIANPDLLSGAAPPAGWSGLAASSPARDQFLKDEADFSTATAREWSGLRVEQRGRETQPTDEQKGWLYDMAQRADMNPLPGHRSNVATPASVKTAPPPPIAPAPICVEPASPELQEDSDGEIF